MLQLMDTKPRLLLTKQIIIITGEVPQALSNKCIHLLSVNSNGAQGSRSSCIIENGRFAFIADVLKPAQYMLYMVLPGMRNNKAAAGYKTLFVEPDMQIVFSLEEIQQPVTNLFAGAKIYRTKQRGEEVHCGITQLLQ